MRNLFVHTHTILSIRHYWYYEYMKSYTLAITPLGPLPNPGSPGWLQVLWSVGVLDQSHSAHHSVWPWSSSPLCYCPGTHCPPLPPWTAPRVRGIALSHHLCRQSLLSMVDAVRDTRSLSLLVLLVEQPQLVAAQRREEEEEEEEEEKEKECEISYFSINTNQAQLRCTCSRYVTFEVTKLREFSLFTSPLCQPGTPNTSRITRET